MCDARQVPVAVWVSVLPASRNRLKIWYFHSEIFAIEWTQDPIKISTSIIQRGKWLQPLLPNILKRLIFFKLKFSFTLQLNEEKSPYLSKISFSHKGKFHHQRSNEYMLWEFWTVYKSSLSPLRYSMHQLSGAGRQYINVRPGDVHYTDLAKCHTAWKGIEELIATFMR